MPWKMDMSNSGNCQVVGSRQIGNMDYQTTITGLTNPVPNGAMERVCSACSDVTTNPKFHGHEHFREAIIAIGAASPAFPSYDVGGIDGVTKIAPIVVSKVTNSERSV